MHTQFQFVKKTFHQDDRGFTILFAVLIASILLAVGISIFNITVKNLLFASSGRESLKAFASADTGLECAEYWDRNGDGMFATVDTPARTDGDAYETAVCIGKKITDTSVTDWRVLDGVNPRFPQDPTKITMFTLNTDSQSGSICVDVSVIKQPKRDVSGNLVSGKVTTVIEARGHNTCDITSQRRLERGVKITYDEL